MRAQSENVMRQYFKTLYRGIIKCVHFVLPPRPEDMTDIEIEKFANKHVNWRLEVYIHPDAGRQTSSRQLVCTI